VLVAQLRSVWPGDPALLVTRAAYLTEEPDEAQKQTTSLSRLVMQGDRFAQNVLTCSTFSGAIAKRLSAALGAMGGKAPSAEKVLSGNYAIPFEVNGVPFVVACSAITQCLKAAPLRTYGDLVNLAKFIQDAVLWVKAIGENVAALGPARVGEPVKATLRHMSPLKSDLCNVYRSTTMQFAQVEVGALPIAAVCLEYNRVGGSCPGEATCGFPHRCALCKEKHRARACHSRPKSGGGSGGSKKARGRGRGRGQAPQNGNHTEQ